MSKWESTVDYDSEWLESVGFDIGCSPTNYAAIMVIDIGYDCHVYTILRKHDGQWSLRDSVSGKAIYLITPMTKEKVLEYIAFVKGMVSQ